MAWEVVEEHLDLAEGLHRIVFENRAAITREGKPERHERAIFLKRLSCPACGNVHWKGPDEPIDVAKLKRETLAQLNENHSKMMEHGRQHNVRPLRAGK